MRKQLGYLPGSEPHYSKKVLVKTWFYYYKWLLLVGALVLIGLIPVVKNQLGIGVVDPDYSILCLTPGGISDSAAAELTAALEALGQDLNGDGIVRATLNQYKTGAGDRETEMYFSYASTITVQADIQRADSQFFLLSDPADFQLRYQVLADADGNLPEDTDFSAEGRYVPFAALELSLSPETAAELAPLSFARRGYFRETQNTRAEAYGVLWEKLTK